jgi:UDP-N-acetylglucosamine 4,6-dehydratase/5-epimerase
MSMSFVDGKSILITGGTGSFGKRFVKTLLEKHNPRRIIVFSRDELKQFEMQQWANHPKMRYFIGDVRDEQRLKRAFDGVDIVVHAAAMKQVPASEYNPMEAIRTNVFGAENVINAAIDMGVSNVLALSTDKAANPVNLYGATKLCSDKLFIAANTLSNYRKTRFSVVRYGNVIGSRGSVIPFFMKKKAEGMIPITDPRMTRFMITLEAGVKFVLDSLERMEGGELFIPKIPTMNIMELAEAVAPGCKTEIIGIRPGEKIHELMISKDDAINTVEFKHHYVIQPCGDWWDRKAYLEKTGGKLISQDFEYSSGINEEIMTKENLCQILEREPIER